MRKKQEREALFRLSPCKKIDKHATEASQKLNYAQSSTTNEIFHIIPISSNLGETRRRQSKKNSMQPLGNSLGWYPFCTIGHEILKNSNKMRLS